MRRRGGLPEKAPRAGEVVVIDDDDLSPDVVPPSAAGQAARGQPMPLTRLKGAPRKASPKVAAASQRRPIDLSQPAAHAPARTPPPAPQQQAQQRRALQARTPVSQSDAPLPRPPHIDPSGLARRQPGTRRLPAAPAEVIELSSGSDSETGSESSSTTDTDSSASPSESGVPLAPLVTQPPFVLKDKPRQRRWKILKWAADDRHRSLSAPPRTDAKLKEQLAWVFSANGKRLRPGRENTRDLVKIALRAALYANEAAADAVFRTLQTTIDATFSTEHAAQATRYINNHLLVALTTWLYRFLSDLRPLPESLQSIRTEAQPSGSVQFEVIEPSESDADEIMAAPNDDNDEDSSSSGSSSSSSSSSDDVQAKPDAEPAGDDSCAGDGSAAAPGDAENGAAEAELFAENGRASPAGSSCSDDLLASDSQQDDERAGIGADLPASKVVPDSQDDEVHREGSNSAGSEASGVREPEKTPAADPERDADEDMTPTEEESDEDIGSRINAALQTLAAENDTTMADPDQSVGARADTDAVLEAECPAEARMDIDEAASDTPGAITTTDRNSTTDAADITTATTTTRQQRNRAAVARRVLAVLELLHRVLTLGAVEYSAFQAQPELLATLPAALAAVMRVDWFEDRRVRDTAVGCARLIFPHPSSLEPPPPAAAPAPAADRPAATSLVALRERQAAPAREPMRLLPPQIVNDGKRPPPVQTVLPSVIDPASIALLPLLRKQAPPPVSIYRPIREGAEKPRKRAGFGETPRVTRFEYDKVCDNLPSRELPPARAQKERKHTTSESISILIKCSEGGELNTVESYLPNTTWTAAAWPPDAVIKYGKKSAHHRQPDFKYTLHRDWAKKALDSSAAETWGYLQGEIQAGLTELQLQAKKELTEKKMLHLQHKLHKLEKGEGGEAARAHRKEKGRLKEKRRVKKARRASADGSHAADSSSEASSPKQPGAANDPAPPDELLVPVKAEANPLPGAQDAAAAGHTEPPLTPPPLVTTRDIVPVYVEAHPLQDARVEAGADCRPPTAAASRQGRAAQGNARPSEDPSNRELPRGVSEWLSEEGDAARGPAEELPSYRQAVKGKPSSEWRSPVASLPANSGAPANRDAEEADENAGSEAEPDPPQPKRPKRETTLLLQAIVKRIVWNFGRSSDPSPAQQQGKGHGPGRAVPSTAAGRQTTPLQRSALAGSGRSAPHPLFDAANLRTHPAEPGGDFEGEAGSPVSTPGHMRGLLSSSWNAGAPHREPGLPLQQKGALRRAAQPRRSGPVARNVPPTADCPPPAPPPPPPPPPPAELRRGLLADPRPEPAVKPRRRQLARCVDHPPSSGPPLSAARWSAKSPSPRTSTSQDAAYPHGSEPARNAAWRPNPREAYRCAPWNPDAPEQPRPRGYAAGYPRSSSAGSEPGHRALGFEGTWDPSGPRPKRSRDAAQWQSEDEDWDASAPSSKRARYGDDDWDANAPPRRARYEDQNWETKAPPTSKWTRYDDEDWDTSAPSTSRRTQYDDEDWDAPSTSRRTRYEDEDWDVPTSRRTRYEDEDWDAPTSRRTRYEDEDWDATAPSTSRRTQYDDEDWDAPSTSRRTRYEDEDWDAPTSRRTRYADEDWDTNATNAPSTSRQTRYDDEDWDTSAPSTSGPTREDWDTNAPSRPKRSRYEDEDWDTKTPSTSKWTRYEDEDWDSNAPPRSKRSKYDEEDWDTTAPLGSKGARHAAQWTPEEEAWNSHGRDHGPSQKWKKEPLQVPQLPEQDTQDSPKSEFWALRPRSRCEIFNSVRSQAAEGGPRPTTDDSTSIPSLLPKNAASNIPVASNEDEANLADPYEHDEQLVKIEKDNTQPVNVPTDADDVNPSNNPAEEVIEGLPRGR
ncbi:hypothetical protein DIPPA_00297 [Diplonema papillatum]|nr:hypothetical protein DIPPA_00297 [Diplonema papillatum]